jgi:hypothetical protein
MEQNATLHDGKLVEIDFACNFKESVRHSNILHFADEALKSKIIDAHDDQLLVVISTINSPKIIQSVDHYDKDFLHKTL